MNLLKWLRRSNPENPATPASWLWNAFGASQSTTGLSITPDNALESTAVWAAVRRISSTIASLPLPVFQETGDGKDKAKSHPLYRVLHERPNPEMSSFVWRELMMAHLLIYGNAYCEIERDVQGSPIALWPIPPWCVTVKRANGQRQYIVRVNGQDITLPSVDVLHIQGFSLDGCTGVIPVSLARDAIGLAKATEKYGASFFGNGAAPSGVLSHPGKLGPEGAKLLRESWGKTYGGLSNAQRAAVLEEGMTWTPLGIPPEHAQFLETRKFQVTEIARLFLIPPHLIGDLERATFSNVEQQSLEYVTHCIQPWCVRIEQELNYKLLTDGHFCEFALEGLLRGDSTSRAAFYTAMANLGVFSINEIRALENMNRIPNGDTRLVPLNMGRLGEQK